MKYNQKRAEEICPQFVVAWCRKVGILGRFLEATLGTGVGTRRSACQAFQFSHPDEKRKALQLVMGSGSIGNDNRLIARLVMKLTSRKRKNKYVLNGTPQRATGHEVCRPGRCTIQIFDHTGECPVT